MKSAVNFLAFERGQWQAVGPSGEPAQFAAAAGPSTPADAAALAAWLTGLGFPRRPICLGLPSAMVFAARIDCAALPPGRRNAMLYRLEEQLPLEAEKLTADFVTLPRARAAGNASGAGPEQPGKAVPPISAAGGPWALGLAVETARVAALIEQLAAAGVKVGSICPTAMLALWEACRQGAPQADFAIVAMDCMEVFRLAEGRPASWSSVPPAAEELARCFKAELLLEPIAGRGPRVAVVGKVDPFPLSVLARAAGAEIVPITDQSCLHLAARAAPKVGAGAGWVDFRRDALCPKGAFARVGAPLRTAMLLVAALLVALLVALFWRGHLAAESAQGDLDRQAQQYHRLFPNTPALPKPATTTAPGGRP